jgi:hypothetical protein
MAMQGDVSNRREAAVKDSDDACGGASPGLRG